MHRGFKIDRSVVCLRRGVRAVAAGEIAHEFVGGPGFRGGGSGAGRGGGIDRGFEAALRGDELVDAAAAVGFGAARS